MHKHFNVFTYIGQSRVVPPGTIAETATGRVIYAPPAEIALQKFRIDQVGALVHHEEVNFVSVDDTIPSAYLGV